MNDNNIMVTVKLNESDLNFLNHISNQDRIGIGKFKMLDDTEKQRFIALVFCKKFENILISLNKISKDIFYQISDGQIVAYKQVPVSITGKKKLEDEPDEALSISTETLITKNIQIKNEIFRIEKMELEECVLKVTVKPNDKFEDIDFYKSNIPKGVLYLFADEGKIDCKISEKIDVQDIIRRWPIEEMAIPEKHIDIYVRLVDILYENGISPVKGYASLYRDQVYRNAEKIFPIFNTSSEEEKDEVIEKALKRGDTGDNMNAFARNLFLELEKANMISQFLDRKKLHYMIKINRRNRGFEKDLYERNAIISIDYEYTLPEGQKMRTTFAPFDLWNEMVIVHKRKN